MKDSLYSLIKRQIKRIFFGAWLLRSSSAHQFEQLHRKNTELQYGTLITMVALALWLLPVLYGKNLAAIIFAVGIFRVVQGLKLRQYHRGLRKLNPSVVHLTEIKARPNELILGKGFEWKPKHTQRYNQLQEQATAHFSKPLFREAVVRYIDTELVESRTKNLLKAFFPDLIDLEGDPNIHGVGCLDEELNVALPISERPGHIFVTGATRVGKSVLLAYAACQDIARGNPVVILDPKGDSDVLTKCYLMARLCGRQDEFNIIHLGRRELSSFFNPHHGYQDPSEIATQYADTMPTGGDGEAFKNFVWQHVNSVSQALHQMGEVITPRTLKPYTANIDELVRRYFKYYLDKNYKAPNQMWSEKWTEHGEVSSKTYSEELEKHGNIPDHSGGLHSATVTTYSLNYVIDEIESEEGGYGNKEDQGRDTEIIALIRFMRSYMRTVEQTPETYAITALLETTKYEKAFFQKLVAGLGPIMEQLTAGDIGDILSPEYGETDENGTPINVVTWEGVLKNNQIVYFALDALSNNTRATAVANMALSSLTSTAGRIYKYGLNRGIDGAEKYTLDNPLCLHCDEVNELMGDQYIPLLNKAGGVGFHTMNYTQTLSDLVVRLGSDSKAGQALGNLNTIIELRTKEAATTEILTKNAKEHSYVKASWITGANSGTDASLEFGDNNMQRTESKPVFSLTHPMIEGQPKGQAFVRMRGGLVSHFRIPMLTTTGLDVPEDIKELAKYMKETQEKNTNPDYLIWQKEYSDLLKPKLNEEDRRQMENAFKEGERAWQGAIISDTGASQGYGAGDDSYMF